MLMQEQVPKEPEKPVKEEKEKEVEKEKPKEKEKPQKEERAKYETDEESRDTSITNMDEESQSEKIESKVKKNDRIFTIISQAAILISTICGFSIHGKRVNTVSRGQNTWSTVKPKQRQLNYLKMHFHTAKTYSKLA